MSLLDIWAALASVTADIPIVKQAHALAPAAVADWPCVFPAPGTGVIDVGHDTMWTHTVRLFVLTAPESRDWHVGISSVGPVVTAVAHAINQAFIDNDQRFAAYSRVMATGYDATQMLTTGGTTHWGAVLTVEVKEHTQYE